VPFEALVEGEQWLGAVGRCFGERDGVDVALDRDRLTVGDVQGRGRQRCTPARCR
jgi:hypothetical protein